MGALINMLKEDLRRMYWDEKMSTPKIAEVFGCSKPCVRNRMAKYGIPRRSRSEAQLPIEIPKTALEKMYWEQEMSTSSIGRHFDCEASVIYCRMVKYGIPRRTLSEARMGEKNPFFGKTHGSGARAKMSLFQSCKTLPNEQRKRISKSLEGTRMGADNPAWKGGVAYFPYCPKFNEAFKESIREKFNRTCFLCPTTEQGQMESMRLQEKRAFKLAVHHVNYNKNCLCDGVECEFVPLCLKCHGKIDHDKEYWEEIIMDKLEVMKCESRL